jgi:hypothetical protein
VFAVGERLLELKDRPTALGSVVVGLDGSGRARAVVAGYSLCQ